MILFLKTKLLNRLALPLLVLSIVDGIASPDFATDIAPILYENC